MTMPFFRLKGRSLGFSLLLCLGFGVPASAAETSIIKYEVSYLGLSLLDMTLTWIEDDSSVQVSYDNQLKPLVSKLYSIHNIYRVHFLRDSYQPLNWSKSISEGELDFDLIAQRSTDGSRVSFSEGSNLEFPAGAFTIFSATHYLASKSGDPDFFPNKIRVFIDGTIWEATAIRYDFLNPHPDHKVRVGEVLIQTKLHYLSGESLLKKNDILTSEIATEGTQFLLWVQPDGSYSRAQFGSFPKAVILERTH
ncbi:MAG: DUF3108 domain-containing protein [Candidatus Marinimicrobia bacterium]|nr:DUF3108 domain-containing protein [Candidatus Neomarinimicrobiota bacterium]